MCRIRTFTGMDQRTSLTARPPARRCRGVEVPAGCAGGGSAYGADAAATVPRPPVSVAGPSRAPAAAHRERSPAWLLSREPDRPLPFRLTIACVAKQTPAAGNPRHRVVAKALAADSSRLRAKQSRGSPDRCCFVRDENCDESRPRHSSAPVSSAVAAGAHPAGTTAPRCLPGTMSQSRWSPRSPVRGTVRGISESRGRSELPRGCAGRRAASSPTRSDRHAGSPRSRRGHREFGRAAAPP
jgi:hypothetical protein